MTGQKQIVLLIVGLVLCIPARAVWAQQVRQLAPGVVRVIAPEPNEGETFLGPIALPSLTDFAWTPSYAADTATLREMASKITLRHNVWNLEFSFKPLRMVRIDVPQTSGKMQQKLIWYVVYRVRNLGGHLHPVPVEDEYQHTTYSTGRADEVLNIGAAQPEASIRFYPHFVLESVEENKSYLDRVIPVAIPVIAQREMRGGKLHNSVEISKVPIPVGQGEADGVWGVATWEDVDPRIDFFSVLVQGLTNAFRTEAKPDGEVAYLVKTLQLNFWRPSDTINEHEREIRYGIPAVSNTDEQARILANYGLAQRLDHLWVYR